MEGTGGFEVDHTPNLIQHEKLECWLLSTLHDNVKVEIQPMITKLQQRMSERRVYQQERKNLTELIIETKKNEASAYFDKTGEIELDQLTPADFKTLLLQKRKSAY
ncbi:LOW QUALITY PROTEIN: hypothetical protein PHPALM_28821 [Phytophthora palmivora]|uniref:Uncharacterized protein n=1 Tax=Phytophthora palmivora TaxID=4796 RepID=A0A2P4X937_9STRA|nr:LOW QUALITY PROTEIN: hypothetical protein PHPALM_28821 [Phytophthora palmivora]